jgi:hypothetical protein
MNRRNWVNPAVAVLMVFTLSVAVASGAAETVKAKGAGAELPAAVAKAVKENRPNAKIGKLEIEDEAGLRLYDIEFKAGAGEIEVAEDGTVIDIATIVTLKDVPQAAAAVIQQTASAAGAKIKQLEKSEVRAEVKVEGGKGRAVKLSSPKYVYEAELVKGKQTGEVQVAPDGTVVEALKWGEAAAKPEPGKPKEQD